MGGAEDASVGVRGAGLIGEVFLMMKIGIFRSKNFRRFGLVLLCVVFVLVFIYQKFLRLSDVWYGVLQDDLALVQTGIGRGEDVDEGRVYGKREGVTPLMVASRAGEVSIMRLLLESGADPNAENSLGETPIFYAASHGDDVAFFTLCSFRADISHQTVNGREILVEASRNKGNVIIVSYLLDHGIDVNTVDRFGTSALDAASSVDAIDIMKLLLERGADTGMWIDARTPLHNAAQWSSVEAVALLLDYHADVDAVDDEGDTPLHLAVKRGDIEIVRLLVDTGADSCIVNLRGESAIDIAESKQGKRLVSVLKGGG